MEQGGGDKGKRKMAEKQPARRARGRGPNSSSRALMARDREAQGQYAREEDERIQRGITISPHGCPSTPQHLAEFDDSYMKDSVGHLVLAPPENRKVIPPFDYTSHQKKVEQERAKNPYELPNDRTLDYRFWNTFQMNFYRSAFLSQKKPKIIQMCYIDWDVLREKEEHELNRVI